VRGRMIGRVLLPHPAKHFSRTLLRKGLTAFSVKSFLPLFTSLKCLLRERPAAWLVSLFAAAYTRTVVGPCGLLTLVGH
jgi:hypothetical protein